MQHTYVIIKTKDSKTTYMIYLITCDCMDGRYAVLYITKNNVHHKKYSSVENFEECLNLNKIYGVIYDWYRVEPM